MGGVAVWEVWLFGRRGPGREVRSGKIPLAKSEINPKEAVGRHPEDLKVNQVHHIWLVLVSYNNQRRKY